MDEVTLYPQWKQAVLDFIESGFEPGVVITHEWLHAHFGMREPKTVEEYKKQELEFLNAFVSFKDELLNDYQIALRSVRGEGYTIVPPREQTKAALDSGRKEIRKALKKTGSWLINIRHDCLTDNERKENTDAIAKLAQMKTTIRRLAN